MAGARDKINVLFVFIQMEMGGAERLVYDIASRLDRDRFNPSIAWFVGNEILPEFKQLGIPLYYVPKLKRIDFRAMRTLGDLIKQHDIDIVNAHNFLPFVYSFYGCKCENRITLFYTEHSAWEIDNFSCKWKRVGRWLLKYSEGAIGVSPGVSKRMHDTFKTEPSKTFSIYNGVDCDSFNRTANRDQLRDTLGIKGNDKIIGIVANFKKIKNHIFLLKAFRELIKDYQTVKLLLVGKVFEGDEEVIEELRAYVSKYGLSKDVLFLGYRLDIPDLLSIMDIFCLTSLEEGLPISMIEAMASGLPVVGTDVEGIRNVIVPDLNGYLVQNQDVMGLKETLRRLLQDNSLRVRMGEESRRLATKSYSIDRCVNEYQDLFISALGKPKQTESLP